MPRGIPLTKGEIRQRLQDLRNKTALHAAARRRVLFLQAANVEWKEAVAERDAEIERLRAEKERLEERLAQKEDALQKLRALLFSREHPHRMHRVRELKPRATASYRRPVPARITEEQTVTLTDCPDCGTPVSSPQSSRTRVTEDIAFHPQPVVTAWTITRHWCTTCRKQVAGTVPGFPSQTRLGPNVLTYVVLAKYRLNLPYGKIRDSLSLCFGLTVSEGEIAHLLTVAADLVGEKWREIVASVKAGHVVHCDETGWFIDGKKVWAHTAATETAVLYEIAATRGKGVSENMLGPDFQGTRVTDALPNYRSLPGRHQLCWAHLTREAQENAERQPENAERQTLTKTLDAVYAALRDGTGAERWDEAAASRVHRRCERHITQLTRTAWHDPPSARLIRRLSEFRHALFTCLMEGGIPPDNNHAERVLRKLVVQRKISGGNRSPTHAVHHAKLMSVLETLRLQGGDLLAGLQTIVHEGITRELSRQ